MAIAAGRRLSDRLFGGLEGAKADYNNVAVRHFFVCCGRLSSFNMVCLSAAQEKTQPVM